ncbi:hypothetical protein LTR62_008133 [Meristemomyces frigidus]|uniref:DUF7730 domain-containing protein n=1 Tax=Meristemomyces frigidus TaxID=1508187 RepID=A0AAN7YCW5_9PEZI|nr:hypothetical protein LTR62_008133 [Meristemomyces frigidus]
MATTRQTRATTKTRLELEEVNISQPTLSAASSALSLARAQPARDHNASLSLFQLPPELRNRIYQHVFGGQMIHVETNGATKRKAMLCLNDNYEEYNPYPCSLGSRQCGEWSRCCRLTFHHMCWLSIFSWPERNAGKGMAKKPVIPSAERRKRQEAKRLRVQRAFNVLFVCRQMYTETHLMIYAFSIFSFRPGGSLNDFGRSLSIRQRHALSHVHYDGKSNLPLLQLKYMIELHLPNLITLDLIVSLWQDELHVDKLKWAMPMADRVRVVVTECYMLGDRGPRMSTTDCREFAKKIEEVCSRVPAAPDQLLL